MAEDDPPAAVEGEEAAAAPADGRDPKQDDVKPVIFIGLFMLALFTMGGLDLLLGLEENGCKMTYMYEYPLYFNISMEPEVVARFPKYGLFAYGEGKGRHVDRLKAEKFTGVPVLFIPGNSGSHKQVRSLASVALRMAIKKSEYKVHFDYFSVDFDEEHSAFYGGALSDQVEYVGESVAKILSLYKGKASTPTSVVVIGHSIGGIIAKALFTLEGFPAAQVSLVLSLATPHTPVLLLDKQTQDFYRRVNSYWDEERASSLKHVTLASIGGGNRDLQVRGGLTKDPHTELNLQTTAVAGVWVSTDHRCIVWCKQLVMAVNRALFDMLGPVSHQITPSSALRGEVLRHHLQVGGGDHVEDRHPATVELDRDGYWSDVLKRQFTVTKGNITTDHFMLLKIATDDPKQQQATVESLGVGPNWVYGCKETVVHRNTRVCQQGDNLSPGTIVLPGKGRQAVHVDLRNARRSGYTHLVAAAPAGSSATRVSVDVYSLRDRWVTYAVPKWVTFWRDFPILEKTAAGALYYNITLTGMENPWQAYTVRATPLQCAAPTEGEKQHFGLMRFETPWAADATQTLLGLGGNFTNHLTAKLQAARPEGSNDTVEAPLVHLHLDPACTYRVTIRAAFPGIMGQLVRMHLPMLLPCMAAALIMVLAFQLRRVEQDRTLKSTVLTLAACVSPVNVVLPSRLVAYLAALGPIADLVPVTDIATLQARNLDFGLLPIMIFFLAIGVVLVLSLLAWGAVVMFGSAANKAVVRAAGGVVAPVVADAAVSSLQRFPSILAALLVSLAFATCGALALTLGCLAFFLRLFSMYSDYLSGLVRRAVGLRTEDDAELLLGLHFQFTLALLWAVAALLNLPTLVAWTQNIQHGVPLPADPSLIHAVILCSSLAVLWQNDGKPRVERKFYSYLAIILQGLAIFIGTFALVTVYRVSFAISAVFVAVASHQLVGPDRAPEDPQQAEAVISDSEEEVEVAQAVAEEQGTGEEGLDWEYEEVEAEGGGNESG